MALTSLVVCAHEPTTEVLRGVLENLGWTVEHCASPSEAQVRMAQARFDTVVVDCQDEASAIATLRQVRASAGKASVLAVAVVDQENNVRELFATGVNFVLYKPVSEDRVSSSFRAARSLMKSERRRNSRVSVQASATLDYANVENVPATLIDLSDEGTALQSDRKLPDCRVYFQFALPGHTSLIRLSGEVVWRDAQGRVGMRFVTVPTSSRRVLTNWLKNNAPSQTSAPQVPRSNAPIPKTSVPATKHSSENNDRPAARLRSNSGNRRGQSRHACRLGADVYRMGVPVPNRCSLTDISAGGCYVEMPTPFPSGTNVEIVVRTLELKVRMSGVVQSVHPGFGMGVKLNLNSPEDTDHLQSLIRLLSESGDNAEIGPVGDPWR
jgi:DNA-binding NarL/FixJ family response regulator